MRSKDWVEGGPFCSTLATTPKWAARTNAPTSSSWTMRGELGETLQLQLQTEQVAGEKKNGRESEGIGLDIWTSEDERDEEGS